MNFMSDLDNLLFNSKIERSKAVGCLKDYRTIIDTYHNLNILNSNINSTDNYIEKMKLKIQYYLLLKKIIISYCCWKRYERKYNASIPLSVNLPYSTILPHQLSNIFISAHSKLGENCVIFQGVTIGSNTLSDSKNHGSPIIGNNVYIGSGATIIGNITIGDNVRIGANTTVTKSIESDCTCVSQPSIILKKNKERNNLQW